MIELIVGTYGVLCWLVFKKWKLVPTNTYTVCTAILIALVGGLLLLMMLMRFHPMTKDARMYVYTTPIVPIVRGKVIEVMPEGAHVKAGDELFRIDPTPFQYEVDRLEAQLADAETNVAQLDEQLTAAMAATSQARANLRAAESDFDEQLVGDLERARQVVAQTSAQADFARTQLDRYVGLLAENAISKVEFERILKQSESAEAQLKETETAVLQATEKINSGKDRVASAQDLVAQAEAKEREARIVRDSSSEGVNPLVRQVMASLDDARYNLENTVVRAPADGYTTQVMLRPGQMAVPMPLSPVMVFVHDDKPLLVGSYPQNVIANFKPGLEVELAFKTYPGRIFKATVSKILPTTPEGQLLPSGQLRSLTSASAQARIPVVFEYDETVADLKLPGGAQAYAAVYTEHLHALSIVRKILLRLKGWENYLFLP